MFMKTLVSTPTCHNKTFTKGQGFITPPQHRQGRNPASAGGIYFGIFAPIRAIQSKEVAIAKEGTNHHYSNVANQFSIKEEFYHEK